MSDEQPVHAGFWVRAGAATIDGTALALLSFAAGGTGALRAVPLLFLAYAALTVAARGRSLGHLAAGVRVVDAADGSPLGFGRALTRAAVSLFFPGWLLAAFSERKRALHDLAAGSVVVYPQPVGGARRALLAYLGVGTPLFPLIVGGYLAATGTSPSILRRLDAEYRRGPGQASLGAREDQTKARLMELRRAVAAYRDEHEKTFPAKPEDLFADSKALLRSAGPIQLGDHPSSESVEVYGAEACAGGVVDPAKLRHTGRWGYVAAKGSRCDGLIFVDCAHAAIGGRRWSEY